MNSSLPDRREDNERDTLPTDAMDDFRTLLRDTDEWALVALARVPLAADFA